MLKLKLDATAHAALPDALKSEYKASADGFVLDTDVPVEDTTALKNALKAEKEHRLKATTKVTDLEATVATLTDDNETLKLRGSKPTDLEKSYQDKLAKVTTESKQRADTLTGQIRKLLVDNVAQGLAGEISTVPELMLPHLKARLTIEEVDGQHITRVLDSEGKASASSVNDLKAEFLANKAFAPIIAASKASGGGASGSKTPPPGGKAFKDMNEQEKTHLYHNNRPEFDRQHAEWKAGQ